MLSRNVSKCRWIIVFVYTVSNDRRREEIDSVYGAGLVCFTACCFGFNFSFSIFYLLFLKMWFKLLKRIKTKHLHWHRIMHCFLVVIIFLAVQNRTKAIWLSYRMVCCYRNKVKLLMKTKQVLSMLHYRLLDSLVVECWHRVREVPGSIPSQEPRHTKDVIKMVPGSSLV